jgi:hypothetical protein
MKTTFEEKYIYQFGDLEKPYDDVFGLYIQKVEHCICRYVKTIFREVKTVCELLDNLPFGRQHTNEHLRRACTTYVELSNDLS